MTSWVLLVRLFHGGMEALADCKTTVNLNSCSFSDHYWSTGDMMGLKYFFPQTYSCYLTIKLLANSLKLNLIIWANKTQLIDVNTSVMNSNSCILRVKELTPSSGESEPWARTLWLCHQISSRSAHMDIPCKKITDRILNKKCTQRAG